MTLWLCGQWRSVTATGGVAWDFQGIFATEDEAVAACRSKWYFITPVVLGQEYPDDMVEFKNVRYPVSTDVINT